MKLTQSKAFLSITELPDIELPAFTIIVGKNGAGKSHLLKALQNGSVNADSAPQPAQEVRLFDWSNLAPLDENEFDVSVLRQDQTNLYNQVKNLVQQQHWGEQSIVSVARNYLPGRFATDLAWLGIATTEMIDLKKKQEVGELPEAIKGFLVTAFENADNAIAGYLQPAQIAHLRSISEMVAKPIAALTYDDFFKTAKPAWGTAEIFQQSFGRLFLAYREIYQMNALAQLAKADGDVHAPALTNEEFKTRFGTPPWDFINDSIKAADLDFYIDAPSLFSTGPYKPRLHKYGVGADIAFSGLSSGERVLMSFAFALYYASDSRQSISRPKLLLLDEVDAPLHPSMCRNLLSTISNVLVKQQGLSVIMTTHSPTTVALADEGALYVMRPSQSGVHKISKNNAIKDLTDGVPTLSVSFDGRRQIFVESPRDVDVYQAAYDVSKKLIDSQVSLNFIATGIETVQGSHLNTGCSVVEKITNELRAAGAAHTYGLLDWDGRNKSKPGIFILAENNRNGLESIFFDPLLLLNALARHVNVARVTIDWPSNITYLDLGGVSLDLLQEAVDWIQLQVLERKSLKNKIVRYAGGLNLLIDEQYLIMDDHELEEKVLNAFPELRAIQKNRVGELMKWIARTILPERLGHTPMDLIETFRAISAA